MAIFSRKSRFLERMGRLWAVVPILVVVAAAPVVQAEALQSSDGSPDDGEMLGVSEQASTFSENPPDELPKSCLYSHRQYEKEPSTRVQFGLTSESSDELARKRDDRGESTYGITMTTAEYDQVTATIDRRSKVVFSDIRASMDKGLGDDFVGAAWNMAGKDVIVYHSLDGDSDAVIRKHLAEIVPSGVVVTPVYVKDGVPWQASINNIQTINSAPDAWFDADNGIAMGDLDESCGQIVIYAHEGADLDALRKSIGEKIPDDQFLLFTIPASYQIDLMGRNNHHNPHRGGLQVFIDNNEGNCTSNIPWSKGSEVWAVTAGHCVNNGSPGAANFFTVAQEFEQGNVRIDDGGANPVVYVNYHGTIEAAVTRISIGGQPSTHIGTDPADLWRAMNWWQWDPSPPAGTPPGIGWDAMDDPVCQGGWGTRLLRCGLVSSRTHFQNNGTEDIFGFNTWFWEQRRATTDGCSGDSGGTVYRSSDRTITGLASRMFGTSTYTRFGNTCRPNIQYGHISYLQGTFGFNNPVGMP